MRNERVKRQECRFPEWPRQARPLPLRLARRARPIRRLLLVMCAVRQLFENVSRRCHLLRPGGRAVDCAPVGQHYDLRQLALRRQVAGNLCVIGGVILQIGWPVNSWIEYQNLLLQFKTYDIDWCDVIGIARHKHETISRIAKGSKTARASHLSV